MIKSVQIDRLMIALVIVLIFPLTFAQYEPSSCLYTQTFSFFNGTSISLYQEAGYIFDINWATVQNGIVSSSFVLFGYKIQSNGILFNYDAGFLNVSSSGAKFLYNPRNNSEIVKVAFSFILAKTCSGLIQLQLIHVTCSQLNQMGRTQNSESYEVPVGTPFRSDNQSYISNAMLSAFRQDNAFNSSQIRLIVKSIIPGNNYQTVLILSTFNYSNIYTRVSFTYILIDLSTFGGKLSYFNEDYKEYSSNQTGQNNLDIPSIFNPFLSQKCIIGLKMVQIQIAGMNASLFLNDTGTYPYNNFSDIYQSNQHGVIYSRFCIQNCLSNTYLDYTSSSFICMSCSDLVPHCKTCLTRVTCSACSSSYFLFQSQCYLTCPNGYYSNATSRLCISMANSTVYQLVNGTLVCKEAGFKLVSNLCTNTTGCTSALMVNDSIVCIWCDSQSGFVLNENNQCGCADGFELIGNVCTQQCGDGKLFQLECDDGNLENSDGCSDLCTVEKYYNCVNGTSSTPSICTYFPLNIRISLIRINKIDNQNRGIFIFQVSPYLISMKKINLTSSILFMCNQLVSVDTITLQASGQLTIQLQFFEDLEGNEANLTLSMDPSLFIQQSIFIKFMMNSNGIKLILLKNASLLTMAQNFVLGFSIVTAIVFVLSLIVHKMIGVELMHTFQVIYFVHLINQNYTQVYSLFKYLNFMAFDFLSISTGFINLSPNKENLIYSQQNLTFTLMVMTATILVIICFFAIRFIMEIVLSDNKSQQTNASLMNYPKVHNFFKVLYNHFVYPIAIGYFLLLFLTFDTISSTNAAISQVYCILIVTISFIYFYQWKQLTVSYQFADSLHKLDNCSPKYIPVYLIYILLTAIILSASYLLQSMTLSLLLISLYSFELVTFICWRPYESILHNLSCILQIITVLCFLVWSTFKDYNLISQDEDTQILIICFIMILSAIILTITVLLWIQEFRRKITTKQELKIQAFPLERDIRVFNAITKDRNFSTINKKTNYEDGATLLRHQQQHMKKIQHGYMMKIANEQTIFTQIRNNIIKNQLRKRMKDQKSLLQQTDSENKKELLKSQYQI